jgi:hypothetical protein
MRPINADAPSAWTVADLNADTRWAETLDDAARRDLVDTVRAARDPDKSLFDYTRADFDLGRAWQPIVRCVREIREGRGFALLTCYNAAKAGGESMVSSSVAAHNVMVAERPDLAASLHEPLYFSRQQEQAPGEAPYYPNPVWDSAEGVLCSKWNRNRVTTAQAIEGVPPLTPRQREAIDLLDEILRRPELMYATYLRPGDMQMLNNHVTLHSRTSFEDHDDPALKRCLFRLWLAPPDWPSLPESWRPAYRSIEAGTVRGGIVGQAFDDTRRRFEQRQAADLGMRA